MVELVDTLDSKSNEAIREGSSPSMGTNFDNKLKALSKDLASEIT